MVYIEIANRYRCDRTQVTRVLEESLVVQLVLDGSCLLAGGLEETFKASGSGIDGIVPRSMRSLREIVDGPLIRNPPDDYAMALALTVAGVGVYIGLSHFFFFNERIGSQTLYPSKCLHLENA